MARIKLEHFLLDVGKTYVTINNGKRCTVFHPANGYEILLYKNRVSVIEYWHDESIFNVYHGLKIEQFNFNSFVDITVNEVTKTKVF